MGVVLLLLFIVVFVAGVIVGGTIPKKSNKSLEAYYRKVLIHIGSGTAGNPQLEAQIALEQEEK